MPHISYIRINMAKISVADLVGWKAGFSPAQLCAGREVGADTNLQFIINSGATKGEMVVRIPVQLEFSFRASFGPAIVPPPCGTASHSMVAWTEANRMQAHAITIADDAILHRIYTEHAAQFLRLARGEA